MKTMMILLVALSACAPEPVGPVGITFDGMTLVQCTGDERTLWHTDLGPYPRGRIQACDVCATVETLFYERGAALGCTDFYPGICTATGACDYEEFVGEVATVQFSTTCEELLASVDHDPCTRPDPRFYWRPEGD